MMRHYPDLGSASDWLKQISHAARPIRTTTQIFPRSFLVIILITRLHSDYSEILMNYFQILALLKSDPRVFQTRNVLYLCICSTSIYFA